MRRAIALLSLCLVLSSCDTLKGLKTVDYRVSGTAQAVSLTYEVEGGGTAQISETGVPWTHSFKAKEGDFLYVSAQIVEGSGNVTVAIYVGGSVYKTATSTGFASIATASGLRE